MRNSIKQLNMSLIFLVALSFFSFVTACSSDESEPEAAAKIVIANPALAFSKTGGTESLYIQSNVKLEVTSSESWCQVAPAASTSTTTLKYTVTIEANPGTTERSATITVKGGSVTETVTIKQPANDGLIVTPTAFNEVAGGGADIEVKQTANGSVTVTCNDTWITQVTSRAMVEERLTFKVATNYGSARTGSITFKLGSLTETVTVKQLGVDIPDTGMESDALTLAAKIYAGWNIGNTLEACDAGNKTASETLWGNPLITESYIKKLKALGFNAVRLPSAWDFYIEDAATYKLKDSWLNRINEIVGYCVNNDMYAIVNIHWDGGWLENNCTADKQEENNKKQKALWTQIANKLNHYDEHLLLAGCNEPNVENAAQMTVLKSYLQTFVDAVRATGGNNAVRNLIVQGPGTDISRTNDLFGAMPTDVVANRLMVEVHCYDPASFCLLNEDGAWGGWGYMSYFWGAYKVAGSDRNATDGSEANIKSQFAKMKAKFVDKGIPVILGEYGAIIHRTGLGDLQEAHDKSRSALDEVTTREAKNHGMIPFYWDTGGVVNRNTGDVKDSYAMDGIMKGAEAGTYPF